MGSLSHHRPTLETAVYAAQQRGKFGFFLSEAIFVERKILRAARLVVEPENIREFENQSVHDF